MFDEWHCYRFMSEHEKYYDRPQQLHYFSNDQQTFNYNMCPNSENIFMDKYITNDIVIVLCENMKNIMIGHNNCNTSAIFRTLPVTTFVKIRKLFSWISAQRIALILFHMRTWKMLWWAATVATFQESSSNFEKLRRELWPSHIEFP